MNLKNQNNAHQIRNKTLQLAVEGLSLKLTKEKSIKIMHTRLEITGSGRVKFKDNSIKATTFFLSQDIEQAIIATDGNASFAIFIHDSIALSVLSMSVEFNSGDRRRSANFMVLNLVDIFRIDGKNACGLFHA